MPTFASMFSGGGLADIGAMQAGCRPIWGIEYDEAIARSYRRNIDANVIVARVQDVDPCALPAPDILHASPVCKEFSVAKKGGAEGAEERSQAQAIARFIRALMPRIFTLENVRAYQKSASMGIVRAALQSAGYDWSEGIYNMADYGVPQSRIRYFVKAVRDGSVPYCPQMATRRVGWYEAIEDLIPTLPETTFAPWQLKRLPQDIRACLVDGKNGRFDGELTVRCVDEPCYTLHTDASTARYRAFIVDGKPASFEGDLSVRSGDNHAGIVTASQAKHPFRAWLELGRVVAMTPSALGRFMTMPDWYVLPDKATTACMIIGNGVCCDFYRQLVTGLMEAL